MKKTALDLLAAETIAYFAGLDRNGPCQYTAKVYDMYLRGLICYKEAIKEIAAVFTNWE